MQVVILAGGRGTRLAEETEVRPKPMVEIGGKPLLWHLMNYFDSYGFDEFIVALGYRGDYIKRWMVDYSSLTCDLTVDFSQGRVRRHEGEQLRWEVSLVDTGLATMTGGRLRQARSHLRRSTFMMTYGDGLATVDLRALVEFHKAHGRLATVTAVRPPARFGLIASVDGEVVEFAEKPQAGEGWINGGFFVLEPEVIDLIKGDECVWEADVLPQLAEDGQLMAFEHPGFWQCMDTVRDKELLERMWTEGAPWKRWPGS